MARFPAFQEMCVCVCVYACVCVYIIYIYIHTHIYIYTPPFLCVCVDCSSPGSYVHGILQAGILKWEAIPFSGDLPNAGTEPGSPTLQADSLQSEPPGKPCVCIYYIFFILLPLMTI